MKSSRHSARQRRSSVKSAPRNLLARAGTPHPIFELQSLEKRLFLSTTLNPTADSYTHDGTFATTNYGTAPDIQSKYASIANSGYIRDAFLKFDLSTVSSVSTATLRLYGSVTDSSTLSLAAYSNSTTSWVESGTGSITWNNMPAAGATALASTSVSGTTAQWYSWDLSSYLQQQKTNGVNIVSIEIVGTTSTTGAADFNSREGTSNQPQLVITPAGTPPTVATAASASPSPVTGTTTALSVLGADGSGESVLSYTWSATSVPSGATAPTFSANATNGAKNSTVTFYKSGAYTFLATIKDTGTGLTATSSVSVTVNQTQSGAPVLSPASPTVANGATQQFTAAFPDQFGQTMTSPPTITWSLGTGAIGSISSTGLYTAPASGSHQDTVKASGGGATGSTTVSVTATLTPTDDSYVYDATPDQNYGSANQLVVKYSVTSGFSRQAYLKFPISSLASIGSATLRLYGHVNGTTQSVAVTGDDSSNNWSESTITWNNRPAPAGANLATVSTSGTSDSWYTWNIGSYVAAQKAAGASYVTLVMRGAGDTSLGFFFSSKEGSSPPQLVVTPAADAAPTIATAASASPATVTGTTTNLSVLGADDTGEANLTYAWSATSVPSGASAPTFSASATNAAKAATATFSKPGSYTLLATITDPDGLTATSSVSVTVNQTLTTIAVSPSSASVNENATQQFSAAGYDQFGTALTSQPTFTWSRTGAGSVSSTGLYTAPGSAGSATVTAASGSVSGNASVTVGNAAPTVATAAAASRATITGTTTSLTVLGADDGGESNLTYTWAATSVPSGASAPSFSVNGTNGAKNATATFSAAGAYTFQATITDQGGLTATSSVSLTVVQTLTTIAVSPPSAGLNEDAQQSFTAAGSDQFGAAMATQPSLTWTSSGVGSVSSTGLYTAPASTGSATVTAASGSVSGSASVAVTNPGPTVVTPASSSAGTVTTGTSTDLSALGSDPAGASNLTYTWTTTGTPPASVLYQFNGTNEASNTPAQFFSAGAYNFQVTIKDPAGLTATSSVSVTVNQGLTSIGVTPGTASVNENAQQQFSATAEDQFANPMASQPAITWSNTGVGSVNSSGAYTAPGSTGSAAVTAASGSAAGGATVTVGNAAPTVATAAAASPSPIAGTTTSLTVLGADDGGESSLTYTWAATSVPSGASAPTFSINGTNAAKNATATFSQAGDYTFEVTISDGSQSVSSDVTVTVEQTLSTIVLDPGDGSLAAGQTQQFTPTALDQFGQAMTSSPAYAWSVTGAGSIDDNGLYTAPTSDGSAAITVTGGGVSGSASATTYAGPVVTSVNFNATQNTNFNGTIATFTNTDSLALPGGYTAAIDWGDGTNSSGTVSGSGGQFTVTGNHTFDVAGDYNVTVIVTDSDGNAASASGDASVAECVPDAPANVSAQASGGTEIDLTWDDSSLATGYTVFRSTDGTNFTMIDTTGDGVDFYNDTSGGDGLDGHTTYYYKVQATNDAGSSDDSNVASATTDDNAPVAVDDGPADPSLDNPYTVSHNATIDIPVLANDTDPDGDPLTIASAEVAPGSQGSVQVITGPNDQQEIEYTPGSGADALGPNLINYTASDGTLTSNTATATVDVTNALPVTESDTFSAGIPDGYTGTNPVENPVYGTLPASDADGDPLTYTEVSGPTNGGTFSVDSSTGDYTYVPPPPSNGVVENDRVIFKVNDGIGDSNYASATFIGGFQCGYGFDSDPSLYSGLKLGSSAAAPILPGQTLTGSVYMGPDDGPMEAHLVSDDPGNPAAAGRDLQLNSDGSYTYTPPAGFTGTDWFTYYATDSQGNRSNYGTVFVQVVPVKTALVWSDQPAPATPAYTENINVDSNLDANGNPDDQESQPPAGDQLLSTLELKVNTEGLTLPDGSTETLSLPSGDSNVKVWVLNGSTYQQILGSGVADSMTWTVDSMNPNAIAMPSLVYVQGISPGTAQFQLDVNVVNQGSETPAATGAPATKPTSSATANAQVNDPSISVFYTDPAQASQKVTAVKGVETAYIPVSWDDENYVVSSPDGTPRKASAAQLVPDFKKSNDGKSGINVSGTLGDLDLVHVVLNGLVPAANGSGFYHLGGTAVSQSGGVDAVFGFYSSHDKTGFLNLLKDQNRKGAHALTFESKPGAVTNIWVEARKLTSSPDTLQLVYSPGSVVVGTTISLKTYEAVGPQNVPAYSRYSYTASIPSGVVPTTCTWAATGGDSLYSQSSPTECDVNFDAGAKVEYVDFSPATGFLYQLPVNVVRVTYAALPNSRDVTLSGTPTQSPGDARKPNAAVHVDSDPANPVMTADVSATLTGPTVDGKMRGVRFIDVGLMQEVQKVTRQETTPTPKGPVTLAGPDDSTTGNASFPVIDTISNPITPAVINDDPWYSSASGLLHAYGAFGNWPLMGDAVMSNQTAVDSVQTASLHATDRPLEQTVVPNLAGAAQTVTLEMDFVVFLAARTIESAPVGSTSNSLYYSEAQAPWIFNGSGTVTNGTWTRGAAAGNYFPDALGKPNQGEDLVQTTSPTLVADAPLTSATLNYNKLLNKLVNVNRGNGVAIERWPLDTKSFWQ